MAELDLARLKGATRPVRTVPVWAARWVSRQWRSNSWFSRQAALVTATVLSMTGRGTLMALHWMKDLPASQRRTILPEVRSVSFSAFFNGTRLKASAHSLPLEWIRICDGKVNSRSSSVVLGRSIFIERSTGPSQRWLNYSGGHIIGQGQRHALLRNRGESEVERGIFLGGNGSFNYYHWMIELLPKVTYLADLDAGVQPYPLLVPSEILASVPMRRALDLVAGDDVEIIALDPDINYRVADLVYITSPNGCPFNLDDGRRAQVGDFNVRAEAISRLVDRIVLTKRAADSDATRSERIFLLRPRANRRAYNEEAILSVCARYGFVPIRMEELPLDDQIETFQAARFIVGPSGGAWTNLIFSQPGTRCLSWLPDGMEEFSAFSNLAELAGSELHILTYPTAVSSTSSHYVASYSMPTDVIDGAIRGLIQGAGARTQTELFEQGKE